MSSSRRIVSIYLQENFKYKKQLLGVVIIWPLGVALLELGLPMIAAQTINKLVEVYNTHQNDYWHIFIPYLVAFAIVGLLARFCTSMALFKLSRMKTLVRKNIDNRIFNQLLKHSMRFHANSFSGALVTQANRFSAGYVTLGDIFFVNILSLVVKSIVAISVLAFFTPLIAGLMFVWSIFFAWVNIALTKKRIYLAKIASEAESVQTAHLADSMSNIGVIKAFAREPLERHTYSIKTKDRSEKKYASWHKAIANGRITAHMMLGLQFVVLILSIHAVMNHWIALGTFLLIQVYQAQLMSSLWNLSSIMRNTEQVLSDATEMADILYQDTDVKDIPQPEKSHISKGVIEFAHMTFSHDDAKEDDKLFEDFTLSIKAGEMIGLVGHSGSGKTTLTRLLLRFADIDDGKILIDGQDISRIRQEDLRSSIAYVPQEPLLFHRSLRENIAYGMPEATDEQIEEAARKAHASEFIDKLPQRYDTLVGERGVKLSGGQRQRIAIARAILKDAPILVLDEATSALDSESEKLIQAALWELMKDRTAIVIAHRLSTIQKMDRIVVLEDGKVAEQGSHKALLQKKGVYAELWAHQSGGFIEE